MHICKVKPIKILEKFPHFQQSLGELGKSWDLNKNAIVDLEHFVCAMYRCVRYHDVNKLRYDMFMEKYQLGSLDANKDADLGLLPPCRQALKMHIKRVKYQVRILKLPHVQNPEIESLQ